MAFRPTPLMCDATRSRCRRRPGRTSVQSRDHPPGLVPHRQPSRPSNSRRIRSRVQQGPELVLVLVPVRAAGQVPGNHDSAAGRNQLIRARRREDSADGIRLGLVIQSPYLAFTAVCRATYSHLNPRFGGSHVAASPSPLEPFVGPSTASRFSGSLANASRWPGACCCATLLPGVRKGNDMVDLHCVGGALAAHKTEH